MAPHENRILINILQIAQEDPVVECPGAPTPGCLSAGKGTLKIIDKGAALERLGKYLQMFVEKKEVKHSGEVTMLGLKDLRVSE